MPDPHCCVAFIERNFQRVKSDDGMPCDEAAERALLGGIFLDNELFFEDAENLKSTDFMLSSHKEIFSVIASILLGEVAGVSTADIITVSAELSRRNSLQNSGGVSYLASLTEGLPRRPSLREYTAIVQEKAKLRELLHIGSNLVRDARQSYADPDAIMDGLQQSIYAVESEETTSAVHIGSITPIIDNAIIKGRDRSLDRVEMDLTWGVEALDHKTKGAFYGELTVLAGESGGGKTQLAVQMAVENAIKGRPVLIFSMEMSKEKLAQRAYPLIVDDLPASLLRDPRGMTLHTGVPALRRASAALAKLPIYIDETSPLSFSKFIARCKSCTRKYGIELIIVDYLQLFTMAGKPEERIPSIMFGSRDYIKKEKKQHLVLLSQFAKESGLARGRKRSKGDLYGGAVIHQAAQNVLIITVENADKKEPDSDLDVELLISKQREGSTGKVMCRRSAKSLRYIPAPPESEKTNEQRDRDASKPKRGKPGSRKQEGTSQGTVYEDQG